AARAGAQRAHRARDRQRGPGARDEVGERRAGRPHRRHREGGAGVVSDVLYVNGRFTTTDERVIGVEDRGFQFGDAVYEVFKFLGKRPIFLSEHYRRMEQGLREIEIRAPWDVTEFGDVIRELLARTAFDDVIVYV